MQPRHLGVAAVLVKSFARIHETNLKKQGVLPLTFADPADYDKVQEEDTIDILAGGIAPDKPVKVVLHHADGSKDEFMTNHTLNATQIEWLKAGSALNLIRNHADRGEVTILDPRVVTKRYGRIFIASLPECEVVRGT